MSGEAVERIAEASRVLGTLGVADYSMAQLCTYRVGGNAAIFVDAQTDDDLTRVHNAVTETGVDVLVAGRGSNLLVSDAGFPGIVVQLGSPYSTIELDRESGRMTCGASALMPIAARKSAALGMTGFEWAVGVPGSIGGGVRMNAGGHGSDIQTNLVHIDLVDLETGEKRRVKSEELDLAYRSSNIAMGQLVVSAVFELGEGDPIDAKAVVSEVVQWRRKHQPGGQNAGSVFRNPEGDSAGRIIESVGLKGHRLGTAEVSTKHANFFQADPDGSADDMAQLIAMVKQRVYDEMGVDLHPENRLIGYSQEI